jgi:hydroxymethylcytosylglucuronate/cytosylglucuronate synthase
MAVQSNFSLLAASRHIGWGGVGKLRLILEGLPNAAVTLYGDDHTVTMTKQFLGPRQKYDENPPRKFDVALVINDPVLANTIADLDVPIVYVDSLPYVRKSEGDVPKPAGIACYCAQKFPIELFPLTSPLLRNWENIEWIDPIVPIRHGRRGGRGIVINVGGLYTRNIAGLAAELANEAVDAYLNLVLFPLVDHLQRSGKSISAICGNINADTCARLSAIVPDSVAIGPQPPHVFEQSLADGDLLITSPGSTTILQAIAMNLPTLLLPAQNRSQIFNALIYSVPGADVMQWPDSVLDATELERLRPQGVVALNGYIFRSLIKAASSKELSDEVAALIGRAVLSAPDQGVLNFDLSALGFAGANQVAGLIEKVALRRE